MKYPCWMCSQSKNKFVYDRRNKCHHGVDDHKWIPGYIRDKIKRYRSDLISINRWLEERK